MKACVELDPAIRQAIEGAFAAATGRLALPLFDLGFLVHDLMGPAKKLISVEPELPPLNTASALEALPPAEQQRYTMAPNRPRGLTRSGKPTESWWPSMFSSRTPPAPSTSLPSVRFHSPLV